MNAIASANLADLYMDVTRNARFQRLEYDNAFNNAMENFIDKILNNQSPTNAVSFQSEQTITDALYTLQTTQTAVPTLDVILYPSLYRFMTSIFVTIGGVRQYCRPTNQNELGPLLEDSFRAPSDTKPYYLQTSTGFRIYHGAGTITSAELNYLKIPATFTIGKDSQLIASGASVLTNGSSYIATEPSVQNAVSYNIGDQFTASGTSLTSGQVILASNTTPIELPAKTHEEISKEVAALLSGAVSDMARYNFAQTEANKS